MVEKKAIEQAVGQAVAEGRGKRKFVQSVDLAVNFTEVDFKKAENRLNVDVVLPHPARKQKIAVFGDGQLALEARNAGADLVVQGTEIASYAGDKQRQSALLECAVLASPQFIAQVGRTLGQALAAKGKTPKPIMPNVNLRDLFEKTRATISIRSRGKYLPTVHCIVGREDMKESEIVENVSAVLEAIEKKIPETKIASLYVKTTMGKAVKIAV